MGRDGTGWRRASRTSYEVSFTFECTVCRERIKIEPSAASDKKVAQWRNGILSAIENGTFDYGFSFPDSPRARRQTSAGDLTIGTYMGDWIKRRKELLMSSTYKDYTRIVDNNIIPALGHRYLSDLQISHVRDWLAGLDVTNQRLANLLSVLRVALECAKLEDRLIKENPLKGWKYRRIELPRDDSIDPFSAEEPTAIIAAATEGSARNMCQFAIWIGLRTSELVALEWRDVDWRRGVIMVSRAQTEAADQPEPPKTRSSTRDVTLLLPARSALDAQRALSEQHGSGRVCLNPRTGEPWSGDQAMRKTMWTPTLKLAKVRYRYPYQTRHTFASMMLIAGEPPRWIADQMGHKDLAMIFRRYGRWIPSSRSKVGSKAVELFHRPPEGTGPAEVASPAPLTESQQESQQK